MNVEIEQSIGRIDAIIKKHDADVSAFGDIVEMYPSAFNKLRAELTTLKQSRAQPAQEPIAYVNHVDYRGLLERKIGYVRVEAEKSYELSVPLYAQQPAQAAVPEEE